MDGNNLRTQDASRLERIPAGADDPVFLASDEFFRLNKLWIAQNPEGKSSHSISLSSEKHWRLALELDAALDTVRILTPLGIPGLIEKHKVLEALVRRRSIADETVTAFSLELIKNYRHIFLREYGDDAWPALTALASKDISKGADEKGTWSFNLYKIFGIFYR